MQGVGGWVTIGEGSGTDERVDDTVGWLLIATEGVAEVHADASNVATTRTPISVLTFVSQR